MIDIIIMGFTFVSTLRTTLKRVGRARDYKRTPFIQKTKIFDKWLFFLLFGKNLKL